MVSSLKAGVVGAGVFGGYHAAKYAQMSDVEFVGVFDPHPERARALAGAHGGSAFSTLTDLLSGVNVVSIASPAATHGDVALAALAAGCHVYIEKPIATSLEAADLIVGYAQRAHLTVACGFLERAVFRAMGLLAIPDAPLRMEAVRAGLPSPRNQDVSVVMDLMIHDLDLACLLSGAEPLTVEAEGRRQSGGLWDSVSADLVFENGFTAAIRATRDATERQRSMRLVYPTGDVEVDFLTHRFVNTTGHLLNPGFAETPEGLDRLGASLAAFIAAVRGEIPAPLAGAADGVRALDLALAVEQAVG